MSDNEAKVKDDLLERFSGMLTADERQGYEGYLVEPTRLVEFAQKIRDEMGYDYLSSVTGVDYLPQEQMEVVYHAYRSEGGPALVFKVQTPRDNPVVPSLVSVYPGADFQEREAWDLLGITFEGHPNLKRILMWEGFEGHPLRKDWKEAYFEQDAKPFDNRWPEGNVYRIEDNMPYGKNVQYPDQFSVEGWAPEGDTALYTSLKRHNGDNGRGIGLARLHIYLRKAGPSRHQPRQLTPVARKTGQWSVDRRTHERYAHSHHSINSVRVLGSE